MNSIEMMSTTRRTLLARAATVIAACVFADRFAGAFAQPPASTRSSTMLTRTIPGTHESIPVSGMGTWQTFDPPTIDDASLKPLEEVTRVFFDAGGRVIDSSPMYGKAEQVTGMVSQRLGINDKLFLATKVWTRGE